MLKSLERISLGILYLVRQTENVNLYETFTCYVTNFVLFACRTLAFYYATKGLFGCRN